MNKKSGNRKENKWKNSRTAKGKKGYTEIAGLSKKGVKARTGRLYSSRKNT
jgi:hypothetical protein